MSYQISLLLCCNALDFKYIHSQMNDATINALYILLMYCLFVEFDHCFLVEANYNLLRVSVNNNNVFVAVASGQFTVLSELDSDSDDAVIMYVY